MADLSQKGIWWVSRVPETSSQAKALVAEESTIWQGTEALHWAEREVRVGTRIERWIVVQSDTGLEQQQATVRRRVEKDRQAWKERLRVLEQRHFACEADALVACTEAKKGAPPWLKLDFQVQVSARYVSRGRPRSGTVPDQHIWTIRGTASVVEAAVQAEVARKAKFIVVTNVPAKRQEC